MKKLKEHIKRQHIKKSLRGHGGKSSGKGGYTSIYRRVEELQRLYPNVSITYRRGLITIHAPAQMRLSIDRRDEILQFLACIRASARLGSRGFYVDFATIEELSPLCAMLLASEIHGWKLVRKKRVRIIDSEKWTPSVKSLLESMGVFDLVFANDHNPSPPKTIESDEHIIRIRSGQLVTMADAVANIQDEVERIAVLFDSQPELYGGIEEAITNVLHWAYKGAKSSEYEPAIKNRWWFTASYNTTTRRFTLMVYDHGIGIPRTLPTAGHLKEPFKNWLDAKGIIEWKDSEVIQAALDLPRSASTQKHRGKGLQEMRRLLTNFKDGTLMIFSNHGEYRVNRDGKVTTIEHEYAIGGTLIVWEVYTE